MKRLIRNVVIAVIGGLVVGTIAILVGAAWCLFQIGRGVLWAGFWASRMYRRMEGSEVV